AKSRTITGGFIWMTLLPLSSTTNEGCAGAIGPGALGRCAGAGGAATRGAVVIFTVGCGVGLDGAGAGGAFGGTTGAGAAATGLATGFTGIGFGCSTMCFGGSTTGGGGSVA